MKTRLNSCKIWMIRSLASQAKTSRSQSHNLTSVLKFKSTSLVTKAPIHPTQQLSRGQKGRSDRGKGTSPKGKSCSTKRGLSGPSARASPTLESRSVSRMIRLCLRCSYPKPISKKSMSFMTVSASIMTLFYMT